VYTTACGLSIAYLSGIDDGAVTDGGDVNQDVHFTPSDIDMLCLSMTKDSKFIGVDILLTSPWPRGIEKYAGGNKVCKLL